MPGFAKSPPELVARFHAVTDKMPGAERRLMFGYPAVFVGGNMVSGLYESTWFVRLADAERVELLAVDGTGPVEIMPGRAMTGYVSLPEALIADDRAIRAWVQRAIEFGQTLPLKAPKSKAVPNRQNP
jgi:TfoX/Sxy family transcriptional regulator of competence genes